MTDSDRPAPPATLEEPLCELLADLAADDPDQLRAVATYSSALETWLERTDGDTNGALTADSSEQAAVGPETYPPGVPERASVSVSEIAGTEYWYYQWRDGDDIQSKTVER
ncbi:hypothetical protein [Natronolimnobius baerhuensis]|uniref:Uncharacterized protein n=1 Tax=Natronolimnobius baerhuensis TaxID=253108 RepID=A0A202ECC8_9EURY|nr:hypothetical protein [Natronolimnobius baerhuensis]OVE85923.1 hypothetical protein B2G88_03690 [Natronolimnobius baerhuensis]